MHIYILPQCSTTAASVLNSAGMDAQFERSCCAISRGILNIYLFFRMLKENAAREEKYQAMIDSLSTNIAEGIEDIQNRLDALTM